MSTKRKIRWFNHIVISLFMACFIPLAVAVDIALIPLMVLTGSKFKLFPTVGIILAIIKNTDWIKRD